MDIMKYTATELSEHIRAKDISAVEVVEAAIRNIKKYEENINAFITIDEEKALGQAKRVQRLIEKGNFEGRLAGVPIAVKDNICVAGLKNTCGSKMLYNFVPFYSASVIDKLVAEGAVIIGKTNMDEFGMGSSTETSFFGATKNPIDIRYIPGGSSGGSAAALAAGECICALGSDTGGSIRQPAAFCGVTGLKPTYGTVSRYGLVAYASSLEQIGPMANNVKDCALLLDCMAGRDEKDATSVKRVSYSFEKCVDKGVKGIRVGIPVSYFERESDREIREDVLKAAELLKENGSVVEEFEMNLTDYLTPAYYIIACAEASSNLARFDGVKYGYRAENYNNLQSMYENSRNSGFGEEVKRRIELGSFVLSSGYYHEYYLKAMKVKKLIKQEFSKAFEKYDVLLMPVTPMQAKKLGESLSDPVNIYRRDICTVAANLTGSPAISVPFGKSSSGMPIGVQLMADCFREDNILRVAHIIEKGR